MLKYMLDTDIAIYVIKNRPAAARAQFQQQQGRLCVSSVTVMELMYGAEKSAQPERNLRDIEGFTRRLSVLDYDEKAAFHTAQIRAELEKSGTPIGAYDQMIAGHARSCGLIVVTNNIREFQRVSGIRIENWAQ
ncbi:plasmid maintenance protein [Ventosimonas gracilis]|uniref:Ribonuclease VapC n=1 Tax=Ventosimonas gracilis TaxID=1680762 RepID=A0A139SY03_9GAMM|nr:tRNA(fMet)-specific endonuclease VapC [Ventosimonas gracilis]KXU39479.1 plasmid maintenance protein [Ventosimonas gracilis]